MSEPQIREDGGWIIPKFSDEAWASFNKSCDQCGCCGGTHFESCPRFERRFPLFDPIGLNVRFLTREGTAIPHELSQDCIDRIVEPLF